MHRDAIIRILREAEAGLRARGVRHAALFGSVARGDDRAGSDIDILVDLDLEVVRTVFDYAGIKYYIADLFDGAGDVVTRAGLKPHVRPSAVAGAIHAF